MKQAPVVDFTDALTGDRAAVTVRYREACVVMSIYTWTPSDIEASMTTKEASRIATALQTAVAGSGLKRTSDRREGTHLAMKEAGIVKFTADPGSTEAQDAWMVVRYDSRSVAFGLFRKLDGGLEVVMGREDACRLLKSLRVAGAEPTPDQETAPPSPRPTALVKDSGGGRDYSWILVRPGEFGVSLCLLIDPEGQVEVDLGRETARELAEAVQAVLEEGRTA